jgi:hypothetical protein
MSDLYKFGWFPNGKTDERYEYPGIWANEKTIGTDRLVIAPRTNQVRLLQDLAGYVQEPFLLLYVLAIPRGGGDAGRYQSKDSFTLTQLKQFLESYADFLERDGRHSLWIRSSDEQTLVYDQHNVIYACGALAQLIPTLQSIGLVESDQVRSPKPHAHHYHAEFDSDEHRLLHEKKWIVSPLRPGDENPD